MFKDEIKKEVVPIFSEQKFSFGENCGKLDT